MKKSAKISLVLFSIVILTGAAFGVWWQSEQSKELPKLVVGTEAGFKPFEYIEGGKVVGFDIDLAAEIAKDQNKQLIVEETAFDGLIVALQGGRVDMVTAAMTKTEDRAKSVNFSDSYYEASQMIIIRKDNGTIKSGADLKNKKIGVQLGSTGDIMVDEISGAVKIQFPAVASILQEVLSNRIDAAILDNAPAVNYLRNQPDLKMIDEKLSKEFYAVAINKNNPELLESVNKTIARLKSDGTYKTLIDKYFGEDTTPVSSTKMSLEEIFLGDKRYMMLVTGLGVTLSLAAISVVIGVVLGLVIVIMRISKLYPLAWLRNSKNSLGRRLSEFNPLAWLARVYTTILRGTPLLVQLLILYYVVFGSMQTFPKIMIAALAFGLNSAAYAAEILRSAFQSLPKGQWEAANSLGFSYIQTIRYITMPQALKASVPSLMNEFITLIKETSVVGWIGLNDLMRGADNIRFQTATAFESLVMAAIIYLILTTVFTKLADGVERRLKVSD